MNFDKHRRKFLLTTTAVSAVVVFPQSILACKQHSSATTAVTHTVEIHEFKYIPEKLKIKPGDSIRWINKDIASHTSTAMDNSWDTGEIKFNASKTIQFPVNKNNAKDTVTDYFCIYHPHMKAKFEIIFEN